MQITNHLVLRALEAVGGCDGSSLAPFHYGTGDNSDIDILRCNECALLLPSSTEHPSLEYHENRSPPDLAILQDLRRADPLHWLASALLSGSAAA